MFCTSPNRTPRSTLKPPLAIGLTATRFEDHAPNAGALYPNIVLAMPEASTRPSCTPCWMLEPSTRTPTLSE